MRKFGMLLAAVALLTVGVATVEAAKVIPQATTGTNPKMNTLNNDVAMNLDGSFTNGPSLSLSTGTYFVTGAVTISDRIVVCRLFDGSTVTSASAQQASVALSGLVIIPAATTTNVRIQCRTPFGGWMYASFDGVAKASYIVAYQTGP